MMSEPLFSIEPGKTDSSDIDATHAWGLPGVRCLRCGEWSNVALSYPAIDLSDLPAGQSLREPRLASLEEYLSLRQDVASVLPANSPLLPGTDFGPLLGTAKPSSSHLQWVNPWEPLLTRELADELLGQGIILPPLIAPKLRMDGGWCTGLVEPALPPVAVLADESFEQPLPNVCELCGRDARRLTDRLRLRVGVSYRTDIFRSAEWTTMIVATGRLVDALLTAGEDVRAFPIEFEARD